MEHVPEIDALLFDVFGTVVDWRSSVIAEGMALSQAHGIEVDWPSAADRWRTEGYLDPIGRIVSGQQPWARVDVMFRQYLDQLATELGFDHVGPAALDHLATVWERLDPWLDSAEGIDRLRTRFIVSPLSNGTFAMLTRMARHAGLNWSCVISADLFGAYKTDPTVYRRATELLCLPPERVMMVAAHPADLRAAARCGLRTAYVPRPLEWGPEGPAPADFAADVVAPDLLALAVALGA
jgi:2-haloacid dehalogenase